jgi:hypothetical protein
VLSVPHSHSGSASMSSDLLRVFLLPHLHSTFRSADADNWAEALVHPQLQWPLLSRAGQHSSCTHQFSPALGLIGSPSPLGVLDRDRAALGCGGRLAFMHRAAGKTSSRKLRHTEEMHEGWVTRLTKRLYSGFWGSSAWFFRLGCWRR